MLVLLYFVAAAALVGVDQLTKQLAVAYLKGQPNRLWPEVFELEYCENRGAAFSFFEGHVWLLALVSVIILTAVVIAVIRIKLPKIRWVRIAATLIVAGGLGNFIDRIFRGFVVDFISVKLIDFPIFNFADCCVCIGAFVLIFYVIFIYREPANEKGADK
jgi:signal peptidase II